jgi:hypothetical protein
LFRIVPKLVSVPVFGCFDTKLVSEDILLPSKFGVTIWPPPLSNCNKRQMGIERNRLQTAKTNMNLNPKIGCWDGLEICSPVGLKVQ